ncbi:clarin-1 [Latimeria chalumnae]|uniref:Clarin 1 n=1 Tax=Latimeria chalumnae TaxID=7897 RepID=H2ZUM2_LATCH|nr:PREDICTED: clarin-1 [Latimeria chalumnae]|eukprot:XP_005996510.1 PREDICTED: clarin-1 [Latimeria chalumnae]
MPTRQKQVLFCTAGVLCFGCALSMAAALGTELWISGSVLCKTGAQLVNASGPELDKFTGDIQYGLFHGQRVRQCGLGGRPQKFSFFPDLLQVIPASIHVTVILFCTVLIVFSLVGAGFFMYNAFGHPYETLHGPMGLYLWNLISCSCGFLVMILFSSEVKLHRLSEKIANYKEDNFIFKSNSDQFQTSFWIILICSLVHFLNCLLIRVAGIQFPFQKSKDSETTSGAADLMY